MYMINGRNDKYAYNGTFADKYEEGILYTVAMLGFMSLKNGDHAASGPNPASTKRIIRDAIATRKAADTLLTSGAVVLLGTWSNGIAVGPGEGFVPVSHTNVTPITTAKKSRKANPNSTKAQKAAYQAAHQEEHDAHASEEGASCDWQPTVILGPAYVAPLGNPPGLAYTEQEGWTAAERWADFCWDKAVKHYSKPLTDAHGQYFYVAEGQSSPIMWYAQPTTDAPTPIRAMPAYTAAAGDTVSLTYSHENGTTTDRVVTIQRMTASGFRGYDHTYRKARNYHFDHITRLVLHTGEEDLAAG